MFMAQMTVESLGALSHGWLKLEQEYGIGEKSGTRLGNDIVCSREEKRI